jgi:hypothetical protein
MQVSGRCHCGAITYQAEIDPATVGICHCADCQMLSGSAYRVSVPAPAATFRLLGGKPKAYVKTTAESGTKRVHAFCEHCGSPVYSTSVGTPISYSLRVGALDKRAELPPRRQIWCKSALPWAADIREVTPKSEKQ